jgi:hypothetical protein
MGDIGFSARVTFWEPEKTMAPGDGTEIDATTRTAPNAIVSLFMI